MSKVYPARMCAVAKFLLPHSDAARAIDGTMFCVECPDQQHDGTACPGTCDPKVNTANCASTATCPCCQPMSSTRALAFLPWLQSRLNRRYAVPTKKYDKIG